MMNDTDKDKTEQKMKFREFEKATAEEGHPLYKGISQGNLENFKEFFSHKDRDVAFPEGIIGPIPFPEFSWASRLEFIFLLAG